MFFFANIIINRETATSNFTIIGQLSIIANPKNVTAWRFIFTNHNKQC